MCHSKYNHHILSSSPSYVCLHRPSVCADRMIEAKRGKLGMEEAEKSCRRVAHARNINNNYIHSITTTTTTTTIYTNNNNKKNTTSVATKNCRRVAHARNINNNYIQSITTTTTTIYTNNNNKKNTTSYKELQTGCACKKH